MLLTSITMEQVTVLEGLIAKLTPTGWFIPEWLVYLRVEVTKRDHYLGTGI